MTMRHLYDKMRSPASPRNFSGIEKAVKDNQTNLSSAKPVAHPPFLIKGGRNSAHSRAEFFCGVFDKSGQTSTALSLSFRTCLPAIMA